MSDRSLPGALRRRSGRGAAALWLILAGGAAARAQEVTQQESPEPPHFYAATKRLREYVLEALDAHPEVRGALARYRAALSRVPQVTALAEPVFTFGQAIRSVETRVGPQVSTYALSQAFPWFGERDLKGEIALQEALAVFHGYRAIEREVILQVKRAYYELAYVDRAIALRREEQSLLEHYEALAQVRYATGQGLQQAVLKIQAEITRVLNQLYVLEQQRASLEARLNTLRGRPPHEELPRTEPLEALEVAVELDSLYELGARNRQELRAAEERVERSERAIDLAETSYWPDFSVGIGFVDVGRRQDPSGAAFPPPDDGKNAFSVSAGIHIPLWRGKYDAAVREASETLLAERSTYANARNEMEFSIRDQAVRIETLTEQIRLYGDVLVPQAEEVLRATEAAYETGQLGVLDLLDGERVLLGVRLGRARHVSDLHIALAHLERAVGTPYPR